MNSLCKAPLLLLMPLLPLLAHAGTLQVSSAAGDSANVVATCLMGAHVNGDVRGCGESPTSVNVGAGVTVRADADAQFPSCFSSQAHASASLGTLRTSAQTRIPLADGVLHNLQSHAQADMQDFLLVSSAFGTLYNNYSYNVVITGATTPSTAYGSAPSSGADAFVQLNIRNAHTGGVVVGTYWETSATSLNGGTIAGTFTGVAAGTLLYLEVYLQSLSGVGTHAPGQAGFAQADYSNTVHFNIDALTPGANTVSNSGYDYATAAAVPEPQSWALWAAGLLALGWRERHRQCQPSSRPTLLR